MERLEGPRTPLAVINRSSISHIGDEEARRLLNRFLYSQEFDFGVGKLKDFLNLKPEEREMSPRTFRQLLMGFFFGGIAYGILNAGLTSRDRLLSPQETDEFYDLLYPTRPKRNLYGLGLQIKGITVPDGILISEHEGRTSIDGVYEYSLMYPDDPRKVRQLEHYRNIEEVIADFTPTSRRPVRDICFPEVIQRQFDLPAQVEVDPDNFEVVFVFPRDDRKDLYSDLYSNISGRLIFLPVSRPPINIFLDDVFNIIRDSLGSRVE